MGSVLEILVLQALAHQTQGDVPTALVPLKRALTLAEPEGYVRLFVDEGPPMRALIAACSMQGPAGVPASSTQPRMYADKLLASFDQGNTEAKAAASPPAFRAQRAPAHAAPGTLVEPLSERELDVLRLLGTELNGPEMAHKLMVSLNTLRTHTKNIYSKLEVNNRQAAIRRAAELDLL